MRHVEGLGETTANGHSTISNGSTPKKPSQAATNGHNVSSLNGVNPAFSNGISKRHSPVRSPIWHGHNREEVSRLLIQGLLDMGYRDAAQALISESGYELESPSVAGFRAAVLNGDWSEAENILLGRFSSATDPNTQPDDHPPDDGLVLAEGADRGQMLFWIRQQKFLELLDRRDLSLALMVLRTELTPLDHDIHQLHALSTLLMCPPEDLRSKAHWPGTVEESRQLLLQDLSRSIAPSVMIREHRLAELFDQVKQNQINQCLYHNTSVPPSLYSDHMCSRDDFPLRTYIQLEEHTGEVWHVRFSPDGTKVASASQDKSVIIYDTTTFNVLFRLTEHGREVTSIAWSPDSSKILSCSKDSKARVWDTETGRLLVTLEHRTVEGNYAITEAAWAPDSLSFITASHDRKSTLCHWSLLSAEPEQPVHVWPEGFRTDVVATTPDGRRVVVVDTDSRLRCFDFRTYREEFCVQLPCRVTGISMSGDSTAALLNLAHGEVHMVDLSTRETVRKFVGQQQGNFMIRNCFGGAAENFVLSGSEDGRIYVWHKENESLIEALQGHGKGQGGKECVNTVDWNPKDAGMFASGGDDRKVRIWTNSVSPADAVPRTTDRHVARLDSGRTSAIRSTL